VGVLVAALTLASLFVLGLFCFSVSVCVSVCMSEDVSVCVSESESCFEEFVLDSRIRVSAVL